jgi:hypothetical protein
MRDEKSIRELLAGMYRHAPLIKDDFQRHGFENFISGLEYCLNDNCIINTQIESKARELGLKVAYVPIGDKLVGFKE